MSQPKATQPWERIELFRRLERLIAQTSLQEVCQRMQISRATLYRAFWRERDPAFTTLVKIYRAYPAEFKELSILVEDAK